MQGEGIWWTTIGRATTRRAAVAALTLFSFAFLPHPGEPGQPTLLMLLPGAAVFGAVANGVPASRLGGSGNLDAVTHGLGTGAAAEPYRHAIAYAVHAVHLGAACAATAALWVLLTLIPRRFPLPGNP
ncbi:hypothetical protein [Streptomyces sp. MNU76]|uniref:hypothetical protein n=1 Tax=Streptomyces sp. MNU76 TaxID=2560026 RepID=UPI0035A8B799